MLDLHAARDLRVLVVGDAIIDEYCYVTPLGKSIKDNMISVQYHKKETFRGGVWAAAEHVRGFCDHVDVALGLNITTNRRFVEEAYMRKLFVVHETRPIEVVVPAQDIDSYDLVIVTDFGHGALDASLISRVIERAKFLAVNTQTNTSNFGFNMITKYSRADYVVLDELEARLAVHDRYSPIESLIGQLRFRNIVITQGYLGATGYQFSEGKHLFTTQPALANKVIDNMGAGDAFLSVSAPFACLGLPIDDLVKIGNAAAAVKVSTVGHRSSVTIEAMQDYLA